ncbi:hypothetical protein HZ326_26014 [Fusarium oxysporum f. sp. albedinis]|nr:hypothetical protein HZ326_26014 [Fusarium oxysporum f. sp. albedinis]
MRMAWIRSLTDQRVQSDGSFIQKFEYLSTIPGSNKNGTQTPWGGYWITITADHIFGNETLIRWSTYLCSRGYVNVADDSTLYGGYITRLVIKAATITSQTEGYG